MSTPTIIILLKSDHKKVSGIFDNLYITKAPGKRAMIFTELDHALSVHVDFEE